MLEFLFNKVAGPQDVARLIFYMHFSDFIFLQVKPCKVMFTKAYLEISQTSTMELFLLQLSHILKTFFYLFFFVFFKNSKLCNGMSSSQKNNKEGFLN